jgi:nucleoid-associated protein YgaU
MSTVLQVAGADLFRLALQYYGDATQWDRIARANALFDPLVPGPLTITIPNPTTRPSDGGVLS